MDALVINGGAPKTKTDQARFKAGDFLTPDEDVLADVHHALLQDLAGYPEHETARAAVVAAREAKHATFQRISDLGAARRELESRAKELAVAAAMGRASEDEVAAVDASLAEARLELDSLGEKVAIQEEAERRLSVEYKRTVRSLTRKIQVEHAQQTEKLIAELKSAHAAFTRAYEAVRRDQANMHARGLVTLPVPEYLKPTR
jgi:predicted  nucleic acid-binding Zn-ribbon protein